MPDSCPFTSRYPSINISSCDHSGTQVPDASRTRFLQIAGLFLRISETCAKEADERERHDHMAVYSFFSSVGL